MTEQVWSILGSFFVILFRTFMAPEVTKTTAQWTRWFSIAYLPAPHQRNVNKMTDRYNGTLNPSLAWRACT